MLDPSAAGYPGLEQGTVSTRGTRCPLTMGQALARASCASKPMLSPHLNQHTAPVQPANQQSPAFSQPCPKPKRQCGIVLPPRESLIPKAEKAKPVFFFIPSPALAVHTAKGWAGFGILLPTGTKLCHTSQTHFQLPEARLENNPLGAGKKQRRNDC